MHCTELLPAPSTSFKETEKSASQTDGRILIPLTSRQLKPHPSFLMPASFSPSINQVSLTQVWIYERGSTKTPISIITHRILQLTSLLVQKRPRGGLDNKKREQTRIYRASAIAISKIRNSKMTDPRENVCTPNIFWILYTYELPRRTWKLTGGVTTYAPLDAYYCHSGETKVVFSFNTSAGEKRITAFFSIFCLLRIVVLILKQGLIQHSSTLYV